MGLAPGFARHYGTPKGTTGASSLPMARLHYMIKPQGAEVWCRIYQKDVEGLRARGYKLTITEKPDQWGQVYVTIEKP